MSINICSVVVVVSVSIAADWMGVDSSIGAGAIFESLSRVSFKKSVICIAVAVIPDGAASMGRVNGSVDSGSFTMFRSKIGVSMSSLSAGSTLTPIGWSSSSSGVSMCAEAVVGMGYAYTGGGNKNRF
uniref:Secreted protein n=1 Tax=Romanomermis culicivorax TaxID=13658 RepID=A0A915KAZ9_ROMCU